MNARYVFAAGISIALLIGAAGLLKFAPLPFFWIFLLLALAIVGMTALLPPLRRTAVVWINLAALPFALAVAELYFWADQPQWAVDNYREPSTAWRTHHDRMGYTPVPNATISVRRVHRRSGAELYNALYTIGPAGTRITGNNNAAAPSGCVWIFGDSYMFGHGLNDEQTLPYQLGWKSGRRYRMHNLAFSGYGPHHMLASLQSGHAKERTDCVPDLVIFEGTIDGGRRAAGYTDWDAYGPRYILDDKGRAVSHGQFNDQTDFYERVEYQLKKWVMFSALVQKQLVLARGHSELYAGIVQAARELVAERYPRARFVVLFWDEGNSPIAPAMKARGLPLILVSEILGNLNDPKYRLHQYDAHPTAYANERIAEYLAPQLACVPHCSR